MILVWLGAISPLTRWHSERGGGARVLHTSILTVRFFPGPGILRWRATTKSKNRPLSALATFVPPRPLT